MHCGATVFIQKILKKAHCFSKTGIYYRIIDLRLRHQILLVSINFVAIVNTNIQHSRRNTIHLRVCVIFYCVIYN